MTTLSCRPLTPDDALAAVTVMARAFQTDPFWQYALPDPVQREKLLPMFFRPLVKYGIRAGQAYGVGGETSIALQGFAIWSKPGQSSELFGADSLKLVFSPLFPVFLRTASIFIRFEQAQKRHAPEPHFYLNTIGIAPDSQGKGLASLLIKPFLAQADAAGVSTYTETTTPSNVPLYEHYGFNVVEVIDIPRANLQQWALYRPAQPS